MTEMDVGSMKADPERASDHVEEKELPLEGNKNDVGYREYLQGLNIEFSPKEERWVRWKIEVHLFPSHRWCRSSTDLSTARHPSNISHHSALAVP